jgi:hypothetical protein
MKVITPRRRKWTTVFLGAYLFIAPWLFGTSEDEASSTNAWIVGTLILTLAVTSSLAFDLSSWMHAQKLRYQARRISPGMLLRCGDGRSTCTPTSFAGTSSRVRARFARRCSGKHLGWRSGCASWDTGLA